MRYYIEHVHQYGNQTDRIYVRDLDAKAVILAEEVGHDTYETRMEELKIAYPDSNILNFEY